MDISNLKSFNIIYSKKSKQFNSSLNEKMKYSSVFIKNAHITILNTNTYKYIFIMKLTNTVEAEYNMLGLARSKATIF